MSDPNLQPDTGGINAFTEWYKTHAASLNASTQAKYKPYLDQINNLAGYNASTGAWDASKWPTYKPVQWGDAADPNSFAGQQAGLDQLIKRIGAGPQSSDYQQGMDTYAQNMGYSPASYTAMQQGLPDMMNASNVMNNAASVAMGLQSSPFGQQQTQAMQVAQRQATEAVGKQLEAIFGERGGLAGFQAAYDMTNQLQSTFLQQQSQNALAIFDRSITAVNNENQYYQQLVSQGAISAQDFVKFRWDNLQTSYQDYLTSMDNSLKNQTDLATGNYNQQVKVIQDQLNTVTGALAQEMGMDQFTEKSAADWYDFWQTVATNFEASGNSKVPGTGMGGYPQSGQGPNGQAIDWNRGGGNKAMYDYEMSVGRPDLAKNFLPTGSVMTGNR